MTIHEKTIIINRLSSIRDKLLKLLNDYPMLKNIEGVISKIEEEIESVKEEKFRIVVFGAFSDGKSSVLSALMQNFDIKIAPEPSTDRITEYKFGDFLLVDTPGIHSDKIQHDEITEGYISRANVILLVCDAINPIKNSHRFLLEWLLKDLEKLSALIVIINKMDLTGISLEDEKEYAQMCSIKTEEVRKTIEIFLGKNYSVKDVPVICISAVPYDTGFEYWKNRWSEYLKLSRINMLKDKVDEFYSKYRQELIENAANSVAIDSILLVLKDMNELIRKLELDYEENKLVFDKLKTSHDDYLGQVRKTYAEYKSRILTLLQEYLTSISSIEDVNGLKEFVYREIGEDGYILKNKIEVEVSSILDVLGEYSVELDKELQTFLKDLEPPEEVSEEFIRMGVETVKGISDYILDMKKRDLMFRLLDFRRVLSPFVKLGPAGRGGHMIWASQAASRVQGIASKLNQLSLLVQFVMNLQQLKQKLEFGKKKDEIRREVENFFRDLININFEDFLNMFGINLSELEEKLKEMSTLCEQDEQKISDLKKKYEELNIEIEALRHGYAK